MENHRERMGCYLRGYPDEMEKFLQKSRPAFTYSFSRTFADYDADELCKIAALIGKNKEYLLKMLLSKTWNNI